MRERLLMIIAGAALAACGGQPEPQPEPTPEPVKEEAPAEPKAATSKLLPWKAPEGDGVSQDGLKLQVQESWLAARMAQPTQKLITFESHERGARLAKVPGGTSLAGLGFQEGDVVVAVEGQRVTPENAAAMLLGALIVDEEIDVHVQRPARADTWVEGKVEMRLVQAGDASHGAAFVQSGPAANTYRVAANAARAALATGGHWTPDTTKLGMQDGGVKVIGVGPKSLMNTLGFKSGDVITTVNGAAPTALDPAWAESGKIVVGVKRDGADVQLTYNLD